ncbi:tetratricopeptide repeat protein [Prolixibacteraceae bacterium JC049]|nr:tetratricopeptide repeat protein [Prolixibacteraceae bacterium JC049]
MKYMKRLVVILFFILLNASAWAQLNTDRYYNVGRSRIYYGNYTGAIENFNIVIKLKPYLHEPVFLRGVAKHYLEDFRGAIRDYNIALNIKPFYPEAYMYRAMAHYELKDFKKAMKDYSSALELEPEDANIYNNRGITWAAMDSLKNAIGDYTKAISLNPKNANTYLNRSSARQMLKDIAGGIADCDTAIMIRPHFAGAYLNRGLAKFSQDDYAGALIDYDECIRLDPQNGLAYSNRGIVKHKLGDYEGAIIDYDKALKLNPSFAAAYMNRGLAKHALKKGDPTPDYRMAATLDPKYERNPYLTRVDPRAYHQSQHQRQKQQNSASRRHGNSTLIGQKNSQQGNNQLASNDSIARKRAQDIERRRRKNIIVNTQRTSQQRKRSNDKREEGKVQNLQFDIKLEPQFVIAPIHEDPDMKNPYFNKHIDALNQKNIFDPYLSIANFVKRDAKQTESFENYIRFFNAKVNNNPKIASNYLNRGIFYGLTLQFNEALKDLDKALSADNQLVLAYFERANIRTEMADIVLSLPDFKQERKLGNSAQDKSTKVRVTDYDQALADYEKVLYMNPEFYFARFNQANIYCKTGQYEKALQEYNKVLEQESDFAEAYYNRGLVKVYLNDINGGAIDLSKAGELGIESAYSVIKRYCY